MILYNNTKKTSGDGLDSYVRYKASFGKVIPPSTRKEIKDQSSISIEPPKYKEFLPLSQEDYITLSKYQLSQELTSNAITTVTDRQPEKVDKMLSDLSDYINNNVHDTNPEANVMFISQESFDLVQDHIIKNIYEIDPQIDQKIQENYNKHNPQSPALTTLSDKDLYLFQNDGYFVVFDSPKIQQELQSFNDDIKNIRETKPTSQEKKLQN